MSRIYHFFPNQTWGCVMCGKCCGRDWPVPADPEERKRISALEIPDVPAPKHRWFSHGFIAKKNGRCIFAEGPVCKIHKKYGLEVKALACRLYPLDIHAWEDGSISASLRYDCPAVANGTDRSICTAITKIDGMAEEIAKYRRDPAPAYSETIRPPLKRMREIAEAYAAVFNRKRESLSVRFLAAAYLLEFHGGKEASRDIMEAENFQEDALALFSRSSENLRSLLETAESPDSAQLIRLRAFLTALFRNDNGLSLLRRFRRTCRDLLFDFGKHCFIPPGGPEISPVCKMAGWTPDAEIPFLRWLNGRLYSLHFCGGAAFGLTFEEGMRYLLLAYPAVQIAASALAAGKPVTGHEVSKALMLLDFSFLRTRLYQNRSLKKTASFLTKTDIFLKILKTGNAETGCNGLKNLASE